MCGRCIVRCQNVLYYDRKAVAVGTEMGFALGCFGQEQDQLKFEQWRWLLAQGNVSKRQVICPVLSRALPLCRIETGRPQ